LRCDNSALILRLYLKNLITFHFVPVRMAYRIILVYHYFQSCPCYHLYLCIWHCYKDKFVIWWEKILLLLLPSPSYCPLMQICNSLPPTFPSPHPSLLLAATLDDLFSAVYYFRLASDWFSSSFTLLFQYIILMKKVSQRLLPFSNVSNHCPQPPTWQQPLCLCFHISFLGILNQP
jgi:hypothetical protein